MPQPALLADEPRVLVEDAEGGIRYQPGFIDRATADTWFAELRDTLATPFTHVGMNFYRDGRDSVAMHNDKLYSIVAGWPIALLSLGDARRMDIRAKADVGAGKRATHRIVLEPGSLLVMSHRSQMHYDHGIPKTRDPVGPRISLAFRVRPKDGRW